MSRCARLRTLSSSATARRYCSQWLLARSSDSASACCSRSISSSCAAVSGSTAAGSAAPLRRSPPDSLAVISLKTSEKSPSPPAHVEARAGTPGWGSAARIQGRAEQFSGHLDDGDDPFVGHARRPDDPEHPDHRLAVRVRRGDHAAIVEDLVAGFMADEDLHPFGLQALVEQVQKVALFVERLEQPPQLLHAGALGHAHEVGLALDDVLEPPFRAALEHLLGDRDRLRHDLVHVCVCLGQLAQDLLAHLAPRAPAELLVQKVRGTLELVGRVMSLELDDAALHLAVVEHQYRELPVLRQTDELHLGDGG